MKKKIIIVISAVLFVSFILLLRVGVSSSSESDRHVVKQGPLSVWSAYGGKLESRQLALIMSKFQGSATLIELVAEGTQVKRGDLLVRIDSSSLEREEYKLKRDYTLAKAELENLENATLPLELRDLDMKLMEARSNLKAEQEYLVASEQLLEEDLVSAPEIEQQKLKVSEVRIQLETLELQLDVTKKYLHPSLIKKAQAKLETAEQELNFTREQIKNSTIKASSEGRVVYIPLYLGSDFRTVRIGDTVYPNQPFMALPDLSDFTVKCQIPEIDLSLVDEGMDVFIDPMAYPGSRLPGVVESVSSMAQNQPGKPAWQRYFNVTIGLRSKDIDNRLRPGMSVTAHVLSYHNPRALLIPRTAVVWESGEATVRVVKSSALQKRLITLGKADVGNFEIVSGLAAGEIILLK